MSPCCKPDRHVAKGALGLPQTLQIVARLDGNIDERSPSSRDAYRMPRASICSDTNQMQLPLIASTVHVSESPDVSALSLHISEDTEASGW